MAAHTIEVSSRLRTLNAQSSASQPPSELRDLSIAVDAALTAEELIDRAGNSLGADIAFIGSIEVAAEHGYYSLSLPASRRLGIQPNQKQVLLRIVLRHPDKTFTSDEANKIRDRIYSALHQGSVSQWVGRAVSL